MGAQQKGPYRKRGLLKVLRTAVGALVPSGHGAHSPVASVSRAVATAVVRTCSIALNCRLVKGIAIVATLAVTACAHDNTVPPPPLAKPDPRICAPLEAPPPIQGGIVQPTTQEQVDAVQEFLRGSADLWFWGNRGWSRAALARQNYCP